AQQRLHQLRFDPERSTLYGDQAPATYGEFLFRCSGPPWREPSAAERAAGAAGGSGAFGGAFQRQTRRWRAPGTGRGRAGGGAAPPPPRRPPPPPPSSAARWGRSPTAWSSAPTAPRCSC